MRRAAFWATPFGHRLLRAIRELGREVQAVIKLMSDAELVAEGSRILSGKTSVTVIAVEDEDP